MFWKSHSNEHLARVLVLLHDGWRAVSAGAGQRGAGRCSSRARGRRGDHHRELWRGLHVLHTVVRARARVRGRARVRVGQNSES